MSPFFPFQSMLGRLLICIHHVYFVVSSNLFPFFCFGYRAQNSVSVSISPPPVSSEVAPARCVSGVQCQRRSLRVSHGATAVGHTHTRRRNLRDWERERERERTRCSILHQRTVGTTGCIEGVTERSNPLLSLACLPAYECPPKEIWPYKKQFKRFKFNVERWLAAGREDQLLIIWHVQSAEHKLKQLCLNCTNEKLWIG